MDDFAPIRVKCIVSADARRDNMRKSLSRGYPLACPGDIKTGRLAIVGSGPSVAGQLETIKTWNGEIWAVNWSLKWLRENGLDASAYVMCDPDPAMVEVARTLPDGPVYYIASTCDPSVFDALEGKDIRLWHLGDPDVIPPSGSFCIPGGTTVMARAPFIAHMVGWREIHLFGFDCSYSEGTHVHGGELPAHAIRVECNGRVFVTEPVYLEAAAFISSIVDRFPCPLILHGDGLAQTLCYAPKQDAERVLGEPRPDGHYFMRRRVA